MMAFTEEINKILKDTSLSREDKRAKIESIKRVVNDALDILSGDWCYCNICQEFYKTKSFYQETEMESCQVKTYDDPINSGGNEYTPGTRYTTYVFCPKGHRKVIQCHTNPTGGEEYSIDKLFH